MKVNLIRPLARSYQGWRKFTLAAYQFEGWRGKEGGSERFAKSVPIQTIQNGSRLAQESARAEACVFLCEFKRVHDLVEMLVRADSYTYT